MQLSAVPDPKSILNARSPNSTEIIGKHWLFKLGTFAHLAASGCNGGQTRLRELSVGLGKLIEVDCGRITLLYSRAYRA